MPTCENCIHYDICIFHIKGNENEKCPHFKNAADVVPKSEVAREIFEDIEKHFYNNEYQTGILLYADFAELKKKYTEGE